MYGVYDFSYNSWENFEEEKKECDHDDGLVSRIDAEARAAFLAAEALTKAVEARKAAKKLADMKLATTLTKSVDAKKTAERIAEMKAARAIMESSGY